MAGLHSSHFDFYILLISRVSVFFCFATLLYSTLLRTVLLYSTLRYSTLLCATLFYSALLYSTLHYTALLYSTLSNSSQLNYAKFILIMLDIAVNK